LQGGLLAGLFLAGMAGSVAHCAPMCGGFVLGQVADGMARVPVARMCERRRLSAGALVPYHLGRITTYAALGAVAGRIERFSAAFLVLGAVVFVLLALRRADWLGRVPAGWGRLVGRVARVLPKGTAAGGYLLGVALGFLPCGLLYGALLAAASAGDALLGAAGMAAFGLGTVPALVVVGVAGQAAGRRWQRAAAVAAPGLMLLNAGLLLALAWGRASG